VGAGASPALFLICAALAIFRLKTEVIDGE